MRVIQSAGGPLIGINLVSAPLWHGIDGINFFNQAGEFSNDYEALEPHVITKPPVTIAVIKNEDVIAFLITIPLQTAIIYSDGKSVDIAQVFYADEDWSFDGVSRDFFDKADYDQSLLFAVSESKFTLFDAAFPVDDKDRVEDCLEFCLEPGDYVISAALFHPDASTELLLYRIKAANA